MLDFFFILIIVAFLVISNGRIARGLQDSAKRRRELNAMLVVHLLFVCLFTFYILSFGGDSTGYWYYTFQQLGGKNGNMFDYYGLSTTFPLFLNYIPARILGLSYFTGNFLYGVLGFIGLRYLYILFCKSILFNAKILGVKVLPGLFFLPNVHFWSAGVGKDTLCFFGIACFLYGFQNYKKSILLLSFAFTLVFHVRPHIGFLLIISTALALLFTNKVKIIYKILFASFIAFGFALVYDKLLAFLKIEDVSVESVQNIADSRVGALNHASVGSAIDLASYSVPYRFFTYLFRPLFFDAHNIVSLISSGENLIYLIIAFVGVWYFRFRYLKGLPLWMLAGFFMFVFTCIIFANSLSNLGIIMRMKNMTMLYFLCTCGWLAGVHKFKNMRRQNRRKTPKTVPAVNNLSKVNN